MKRYCKNIDITDRVLISIATYKCLKDKYTRSDTLELLSQVSGLSKNKICRIYKCHGKKAIKPFIELLIDTLQFELINKNISFPAIWYNDKEDSSSHKIRHIGIQNVKQQIYDYIAVEGLKPIFHRIGVHQYASIRGKGTLSGARQISRWLRNKSLTYFVKLDIKKCYPSIPQDKLIQFLEKHIKNDMLLWLIKELLKTFDKGLSIGSYLSQYLCNLYLSQVYHFIGHLHKIRNHKNGTSESVRLVYHRLFYMDDMFLMGTAMKDVRKSVKEVIKYCKILGVIIKSGWSIVKVKSDIHGNPIFIDMMGFRIYRDHATIRKRVFKRIRRVSIRIHKRIKLHMKIPIEQARRMISYWGNLKHSNSTKVIQKYHIKDIMKICKKAVSNYEKSKIYRKTTVCYSC